MGGLVVLELEQLVALLLDREGRVVEIVLEGWRVRGASSPTGQLEILEFLHEFALDALLLLLASSPLRVHDIDSALVLVDERDDRSPRTVWARDADRGAAGERAVLLGLLRCSAADPEVDRNRCSGVSRGRQVVRAHVPLAGAQPLDELLGALRRRAAAHVVRVGTVQGSDLQQELGQRFSLRVLLRPLAQLPDEAVLKIQLQCRRTASV
mmetsp:Transcript_106863/g.209455  ORF Transcript_106863/g.209455 Transcript_106863/m.209455 type:complete len:210 (-) Transcript_106863:35-664(-)